MAVNRYDRAAEAAFINTYAPIDFGALYQIGAANNAAVEKAQKELGANLAKWSEFKSPSTVDTKRYYDLTMGHLKNTIQKAAQNPEFLKTAAGRAELQGMINSVDYASLGQLKQSADNLKAGLEIRAKMKAEGLYNEDWDDVDIANYDTLGRKEIFSDITPVKYMTANELSNKYFDNLKRGDIDFTWKDGVKYRVIGNTEEDLEQIYDRYRNDLINTPQGKKYLQDFKRMGYTDQEAEQQFREMIIGSQMDRIIRPELRVDEGWLALAKLSASGKSKGSAKKESEQSPTRIDFWNSGVKRSTANKASEAFQRFAESDNENIRNSTSEALQKYQQAADAHEVMLQHVQDAAKMYQQTGKEEYAILTEKLANKAKVFEQEVAADYQKFILNTEFENTAKFKANDKEQYSHEGYIRGVNSALDNITTHVAMMHDDDAVTGLGARYLEVKDSDGSVHDAYLFKNSKGFLLPETMFNLMTGNQKRDHKYDTVRKAVESGNMSNVQFLPTDEMIKVGDTFVLQGKLRISEDELENKADVSWYTSNAKMLKTRFGGSEVEEIIGDDGKTYYEITAYRVLPNNSPEYYQRLNQRWQGGGMAGIGGASQAKDTYIDSAEQIYNNGL